MNISKFDELGHIEQQWQEIKVTGLSFCCSHKDKGDKYVELVFLFFCHVIIKDGWQCMVIEGIK